VSRAAAPIDVELEAVIVAVTEEEPRILTLPGHPPALPSGLLDPEVDRTLDRGLRRWVQEQTGIEVGYVEQLYTFGDRDRHPREREGGPRMLSVGYLALIREERPSADAAWTPWYELFPWEDHRGGRPPDLDEVILPGLRAWAAAAGDPEEAEARLIRARIAVGVDESSWDEVRVLERYELLYEARLVPEFFVDRGRRPDGAVPGLSLLRDHRRIAATALSRIRGKLSYRPLVFELLPGEFTLLTLQRVVEALAGIRLHKQNFRRVVERAGLVEGTGRHDPHTGGRPAELFRFRREVLLERPRPGVRMPGR
jgi:hypothetical protein